MYSNITYSPLLLPLLPLLPQFFANAFTDDEESVSSLSASVYELITELHVIDNHLLLSVLPQLEYKLNVRDIYCMLLYHSLLLLLSLLTVKRD